MRIVTWNIQWGRGADGRVDLKDTIATLREGGAPEVICLQEVAINFPDLPGGAREDVFACLAEAFPTHEPVFATAVDAPDGEGGRARFGNMVLSSLPVGQVFRHLLPWPADPGVPSMPRVCLEVVVEAPWGPLRVLTTHLEYYSEYQRLAQVDALRTLQISVAEHLAAGPSARDKAGPFRPRPRPVSAVLCGDFNCEPFSLPYDRLLDPLIGVPPWVDAWSVLYPETPHTHTVGLQGADWPDQPYCCDFMFVTADLAPRLADMRVNLATAASDHQPLTLLLQP